jgi:hypothetical protein
VSSSRKRCGGVSELADDLDLESSAARREGSNPSFPTKRMFGLIDPGPFLYIPIVIAIRSFTALMTSPPLIRIGYQHMS